MRTLAPGAVIVALSADAMNALDAAGMAYRTPDEYVPSAALNAAGVAAYDPVAAYCHVLDRWLADRLPESAAIAPATTSFYELKILHDALALRAMEVDAILEEEKPSRVFAARAAAEPDGVTTAFSAESAYARVLEAHDAPGVIVEWWSAPASVPVPLKQQRTLTSMVPPEWRQRLSLFRAAGIGGLGQHATRETVLLLNITPDIRAAMQSDNAEGLRFVHWQGSGQPMTVRPLRMRGDARIRHSAPPRAIVDQPPPGLVAGRLDDIARARIARFVGRDVPQMIAAAADAAQVVDHYEPSSAVAGIIAGPRARGAAAGLRAGGVPLTLCQHGGSYGYIDHPIHYFNDLRQADRFVTYGEGVTADLTSRYGTMRPVAECITAGSASLAPISASRDTRAGRKRALGLDDRPLVVYAATCLMGQRFYAPHYRSPEYFGLLTAAAEALASLAPDVQVVLKTHQRGDNAFNPIEDWCRRHGSSIRIVSSGGLEPWLGAADAVAMDLPGTPLLEALAHRVPVLAYLPPGTFQLSMRGERLLRAAVTLETSRDRFLDRLTALPGSASLHDADAFLAAYGTNPAAGDALARALAPHVEARA